MFIRVLGEVCLPGPVCAAFLAKRLQNRDLARLHQLPLCLVRGEGAQVGRGVCTRLSTSRDAKQSNSSFALTHSRTSPTGVVLLARLPFFLSVRTSFSFYREFQSEKRPKTRRKSSEITKVISENHALSCLQVLQLNPFVCNATSRCASTAAFCSGQRPCRRQGTWSRCDLERRSVTRRQGGELRPRYRKCSRLAAPSISCSAGPPRCLLNFVTLIAAMRPSRRGTLASSVMSSSPPATE